MNSLWNGMEALCRFGINNFSFERYFCNALAIRTCSCSSLHSLSDGEITSCCATDEGKTYQVLQHKRIVEVRKEIKQHWHTAKLPKQHTSQLASCSLQALRWIWFQPAPQSRCPDPDLKVVYCGNGDPTLCAISHTRFSYTPDSSWTRIYTTITQTATMAMSVTPMLRYSLTKSSLFCFDPNDESCQEPLSSVFDNLIW